VENMMIIWNKKIFTYYNHLQKNLQEEKERKKKSQNLQGSLTKDLM